MYVGFWARKSENFLLRFVRLEEGGTFEDVATALANFPDVVRKHYAQFSKKGQERAENLLAGRAWKWHIFDTDSKAGCKLMKITEVFWWTAWDSENGRERSHVDNA